MSENQKQNESDNIFLMSDMPDTQLPDLMTDGAEQLFTEESGRSRFPTHVDESIYRKTYKTQDSVSNSIWLPLLGARTAAVHRTVLLVVFVVFFAIAAWFGFRSIKQSNFIRKQSITASITQVSSIQLSQALDEVILGNEAAFDAVTLNYRRFHEGLSAFKGSPMPGQEDLSSPNIAQQVQKISGDLDVALDEDIKAVIAQKQMLMQLAGYIDAMDEQVLAIQMPLSKLKRSLVERGAPIQQAMAASELSALIEHIEKTAREFLTPSGLHREDGKKLTKDLVRAKDLLKTLAQGDEDLEIAPLVGVEMSSLNVVRQAFTRLHKNASVVAQQAQEAAGIRQAYMRAVKSLRAVEPRIAQLSNVLNNTEVMPMWQYTALLVCGFLALVSAGGLAYVQVADTKRMQVSAEAENRKNQAAIFRLVDELDNLSKGDLTQEATVSDDITDTVADSVNVTVEGWRELVGNVQTTADRVVQTTADVELTSSTLLEASTEQLTEIRNTGTSVLDMASRIHDVSSQAQESALVAQRSRQAAEQGFRAVQTSIESMNVLRDQIQDTSKRIKRLGESSQEIGEITELISDITEQTNVLALNAAIQAASAGEAGRGFSVVAEEVQRLAERSAEATKQIAALVKAIQTDTHDAVAAMERSTQGVVQGAKLSDNAGQALGQIDTVSRQLAELIQKISVTTDQQAQQANMVANNIQEIFSVTEQTTEGTRTTAQEVRELAKVAQELLDSVARFKIK